MAMPRATSPAASERGLPTSLMTRSVISAARAARASAAAPSAADRAGAGTLAQSRAPADHGRHLRLVCGGPLADDVRRVVRVHADNSHEFTSSNTLPRGLSVPR